MEVWDSSVNIVTVLWLDHRFRLLVGIFVIKMARFCGWGPACPVRWVLGALPSVVQWLGREGDLLPRLRMHGANFHS
jgi:hypothetical protein